MDLDLIEKLVGYLIDQEYQRGSDFLVKNWSEMDASKPCRENGAILIFLPGTAEIDRLVRMLRTSTLFPSFLKVEVLPLHASLSTEEQKRVFADVGDRRKIVVATNVAETSITLPDVTIVIDSCLAKQVGYDTKRRISRLQMDWISKASTKQRAGRAGRVQTGVCFRLITKAHWERLKNDTPPEITRTPLPSFCLTVLSFIKDQKSLHSTLKECLTPPETSQIDAALLTLREVGAIEGLALTALGRHLMKMPMDVKIGKEYVSQKRNLVSRENVDLRFVAKMRGFDFDTRSSIDAWTFAFRLSEQQKGRSQCSKNGNLRTLQELQKRSHGHRCSDSNVPSNRNRKWDASLNLPFEKEALLESSRKARQFCQERFLSYDALCGILEGRKDFVRVLEDLGFVSVSYAKQVERKSFVEDSVFDEYATNSRFVRSALCAGFAPNLLRVRHPPKK